MKNLEVLGMIDTRITDDGVRVLRRALPNCTILH